jgi:hypothetical protein
MLRQFNINLNLKKFKYNFKFFSSGASKGPPHGTPTQQANPRTLQAETPTTPAVKTKEQLKIEALMEQWPECVRNPGKDVIMQINKEHMEAIYKYYQGDKKNFSTYDLPVEIIKDINAYIMAQSPELTKDVMLKYDGFIPDSYFVKYFHAVTIKYPDITPDFFSVMLPKMKKIIMNADRNTIPALSVAGIGCANINLADTEFWEIFVILFY